MRCPAMMPTITLTWQPRSPGNPARSSPANTKDFPPRPLAKRSVRVTDPSRPNWPVGQPVRSGPLPDAREAVPDRENRLLSGPSASALGGNRTPNLLIRSQMLYPIELRALVEPPDPRRPVGSGQRRIGPEPRRPCSRGSPWRRVGYKVDEGRRCCRGAVTRATVGYKIAGRGRGAGDAVQTRREHTGQLRGPPVAHSARVMRSWSNGAADAGSTPRRCG